MATAKQVLEVAKSWLGYSEFNGKFKEILEVYNSHKPLARGYTIKPTDEWCDAFVSAVAIKAGATDIIGTEVGCEKHIAIFKEKGIWIEDGQITPRAGDLILFNWDSSSTVNDGYSDHIGYVEAVHGNMITCIEGNKGGIVAHRTIPVGWGYIRGFARPNYEEESTLMTQEEFNDKMNNYLAGLKTEKPGEWSEAYRRWAEDLGLIQGSDANRKGDEEYRMFVTKEQMVIFAKNLYDILSK